jgi:hypothetical protein
MKNVNETAKAELIAQLVKKNVQGVDASFPCARLCLTICRLPCLLDK